MVFKDPVHMPLQNSTSQKLAPISTTYQSFPVLQLCCLSLLRSWIQRMIVLEVPIIAATLVGDRLIDSWTHLLIIYFSFYIGSPTSDTVGLGAASRSVLPPPTDYQWVTPSSTNLVNCIFGNQCHLFQFLLTFSCSLADNMLPQFELPTCPNLWADRLVR